MKDTVIRRGVISYDPFIENLKNNWSSIKSAVKLYIANIGKEKAEEICENAVNEFYADYDPKTYSRLYDLKNAYEIRINGTDLEFSLGYEFMKYTHRVDNSYIYQLSFVEGYHGGAKDGPGHPEPGTPYWRTPTPWYTWWGDPATSIGKENAPRRVIMREWESFVDEFNRNEEDYILEAFESAVF